MTIPMLEPGSCVVFKGEVQLYDPGVKLLDVEITENDIPEIGEYRTLLGTMMVVLPLDDKGHYLFTMGNRNFQNQSPIDLGRYVHVCKTKKELQRYYSHSKVKNGLKIQTGVIKTTKRKLKVKYPNLEMAEDL